VPDLSLLDELVECRGRLGEGDVGVGPVHLVDVDVIDPERTQAVLDAGAKKVGARVANQAVVGHPQAALGRDHDLVAALVQIVAQGPAEQLLGGAEPVAPGCVEEVDSQLAGLADRGDRLLLVELSPFAPELPGTEGDRRYLSGRSIRAGR
jgi:hypothetical protein